MQLKGQNLLHFRRGDSALKVSTKDRLPLRHAAGKRLGLNFQMLQEVTELSPSQSKLVKSN